MASAFETNFIELAIPSHEDEFGASVQLCRGPLKTAAFVARRDSRAHVAMAEDLTLAIRVEQRVFYLPIEDCVFNGTETEPQPRDRIIEGSETWEIHFPDQATKAVERHTNGYDWKCNTRLVV